MYGSDSEEENVRNEDTFVELKPEVVELPTLHRREEELYFYDTFAYPWEKEKHYKMVYQLEKKYFPDQCLDKAFLQSGQSNAKANANLNADGKGKAKKKVGGVGGEKRDVVADNKMVFFEGKGEEMEKGKEDGSKDLTEKKVEEFFKGLKKVPNKEPEVVEPFFSSRRTGLPPVWDGPYGTVLLVNKLKGQSLHGNTPFHWFTMKMKMKVSFVLGLSIKMKLTGKFLAGWTSFTVCGKLRRLVNVKKVLFCSVSICKFTSPCRVTLHD